MYKLFAVASVSIAAALVGATGARSASISSASQKVSCASGVGPTRRQYACKTQMQLVCHKSPGRTVLSRIPRKAYWFQPGSGGAMAWHVDFVPYHFWGPAGAPVTHGRVSIETLRGVRREEAVVSFSSGVEVIIWARCS